MRIHRVPSRFRDARRALSALLLAAVLPCAGCTFYRSLGKGQHLERDRPAPHHEVAKNGKEIVLAVTTDASGAVADVVIQKSSGSDAVDNYVATSVRAGWPAVPSTRSLVRLEHSPNGGFSDPQIISSTPVQ